MNIKDKLIKIADLFDKAGETEIADMVDETLLELNEREDDVPADLTPKTLDDFTQEEKNVIRAFMVLFFPELEREVDKSIADKIHDMIANHIG